jgi:hypothetical protein
VVDKIQNKELDQDIWSLYLYALKSPITREKYQRRLEKFFDFLVLDGARVEEKSKSFLKKIKEEEGSQWAVNSLLKFMQHHLYNKMISV